MTGSAGAGSSSAESAWLRWLAAIVARRRGVAAGALALALVAACGLGGLEADNSPRIYAPQSGPAAERFAAFERRFGHDQSLRIVLSGERLLSADGLAELARLDRAAAALPGVLSVSSLASTAAARAEGFPPTDLERFRAQSTSSAWALGLGLVAADGGAATLLVAIDELATAARNRLVTELEQLTVTAGAGLEASLAGGPLLERALDRSASEIATRFLPLLALFALLLLAWSFRDLSGVLVPLAFVGFCELVVVGALGAAGVRIHLVLALLPPLLFVVALANAVHLLIRCRALEAEGLSAVEATLVTYREKGRALVWTGISTASGFLSLLASDVRPVRELGLWAAAGLLVQLGAVFTLYPALLALTAGRRPRLPERALEERLERWGGGLASWAARERRGVLALYFVLALVGAFGLARLGADSDALRYLAAGHPVRQAFERSEALGFGVATIELDLVAPAGADGFATATALGSLSALARELDALPGVLGVVSAAELVDDVAALSPWAALASPAELRGQGLELLGAEPEGRAALAHLLTADSRAARLTLFVPTAGNDRIEPLARAAEQAARRAFPGVDVAATGTLRLVLGFHHALLGTLGASLGWALPAMFLIFLVLLRRGLDALKALVPNVWPIVVLLGGMGWLGLELDLATVMVASIVLGLVVDDTIHTLAHYREEQRVKGARRAVCERIERTAPAYLVTGAILAAGFGVCALSSFEPIARFGALSATAIVLAVISDLVLLPALFGGGAPATMPE